MDAASTADHRRTPPPVFQSTTPASSITPPLWFGSDHTGSNFKDIFPPPPPISPLSLPPPLPPPLHPLQKKKECPPAAIVAKMWSGLLFPARLHLFPPALIPDRGFHRAWELTGPADRRTEGEKRGFSPGRLNIQVPKLASLAGGQTETVVVKL